MCSPEIAAASALAGVITDPRSVGEKAPATAAPAVAPGGVRVATPASGGQGSSREHAALAPRSLGLVLVAAKSFSRIHRQNLINFGVLPATFTCDVDYNALEAGAILHLEGVHAALRQGGPIRLRCKDRDIELETRLSRREREIVLAGGLIESRKQQLKRDSAAASGAAQHA